MKNPNTAEFIRAVYRFQTVIPLDPGMDPNSFLTDVFRLDCRCGFYISAISCQSFLGRRSMHVAYCNRDIPPERVYRVHTPQILQQILNRETNQWSEGFGVMLGPGVDVSAQVSRFLEAGGNPQLSGINFATGELRWGWAVCRMEPVYRADRKILMAISDQARRAAGELSRKLFMPGMPPEAKCLAAHNYLASQARYDGGCCTAVEEYRRHSAAGALLDARAVCDGYADAFRLLMDLAGIDCVTVVGSTRCSGQERHAWNLVKLPGEGWFHVDVTWDQDPCEPSLNHYLLADKDLGDRSWDRRQFPAARGVSSSRDRAIRWLSDHALRLEARGFPPQAIPKTKGAA